jgi:hypothetical protein
MRISETGAKLAALSVSKDLLDETSMKRMQFYLGINEEQN